MSKVIKSGDREACPYIFPVEKQRAEVKREPRPDRLEGAEGKAEREYLTKAVGQSEMILNTARREGLLLKEEYRKQGYEEGYEQGRKEGCDQAVKEHSEAFARDREEAKSQLKAWIEDGEKKKSELLDHYLEELKDIAVAIAEKVIRISLRTSGETIKHMIVSAAGGLEKKEWAKVYISKYDIDLMVEGDGEFLSALADLSTNVKIIKMENEEQGTCILELPDEIVDLSVNTQMANIRGLLDHV